MQCPFCPRNCGDLFGLSLHIDDDHADRSLSVGVHVNAPATDIPIFECDIDAIYRTRPDLVAPSRMAVVTDEFAHALQCAWHGKDSQSQALGMMRNTASDLGGTPPIWGVA